MSEPKNRQKKAPKIRAEEEGFTVSCGNVFADLGLPRADLHLKAARRARTKEEFQRLCRDIPKS